MTSPPLNVLALEDSAFTLWNEFLGSYFDGGAHSLGTNPPVAFPLVDLVFQLGFPPQPMQRPAITTYWITPSFVRKTWLTVNGARDEFQEDRTSFVMMVRATTRKAVMDTAALLYALLRNTHETYALAGKGLHLAVTTPPVLIVDGAPGGTGGGQYFVHQLTARARLRYALGTQVNQG